MDNPVTFSDITLLNTLATCANMTTDEVFKDFKIMANKKILENHKYEIYYSESEKSWRTYLPDETKPNKRRPVKRKSKENLEKEIIRFYIEKQKSENRQNVTLEELYAEWLLYKRDYTSVKAKTIQEYVSEWNRFFKDTELVKMKIGEIKPITLIRFFREATKDRQFTHKRVSNARSVLNGIMSYAIRRRNCTKSLARWLALRTIRSPLFLKNKSSSFFVYVILLSYHTQTITHKRTAMLMLSCFFILNNYISDFFIRPPPFRCLFLLFLLQTSFILGGSLWTNILILTER